MPRAPAAFRRDATGSVAVLTALVLVALVAMAALAVDLGTVHLQKRRLQGATDLAAIAAASDLPRADAAAAATLSRNGFAPADLASLETGRYLADPSLAPESRFTPLPATSTDVNAVRLGLRHAAPLYFGRFFTDASGSGIGLASRAVAMQANVAAFAIGSRLASLDGGLLNAVLGALLGSQVSLSLMDYQALATARVDLLTFLGAAALRAGITAGTYDDLLDARLRTADVLLALGDAARADPTAGTAAGAALSRLAATAGTAGTLSLRGLVDLGPQDGRNLGTGALAASVPALDLIDAAAALANGTRQADVAITTSLPGIASASLSLRIGQRPVGTSFVAVGARGAMVSTAQMRLLMTVRFTAAPPLATASLPILIDAARSTATLRAIQCDAANSVQGVTLDVQPGLVDGWIGTPSATDLTDLSSTPNPLPATLAQVGGLVTVTGRARATLGNLAPTPIAFTAADIAQAVKKRTSTTDSVAALLAGLNRDLTLRTSVAGLGVPVDYDGLTAGVVSAAAPAVDQLLTSALSTLGIGLGQADVWVAGVRCGGGVLVN